jgi:hypothetical protein
VLLGGLLASRLGDVVVTYHGLRIGLVETNPVASAAMELVGAVPGLVGLSLVVLGVIVGTGEAALRAVPVPRRHWRSARVLWYGGPTLVWVCVCAYNLSLILIASVA